MKKLLAAMIACTFATVAFAQDKMKEEKKVEATPAPMKDAAPKAAAPAKDAAPKAAAPAKAADKKKMAADKKKMAADKRKMAADKSKEEMKKDVKKP